MRGLLGSYSENFAIALGLWPMMSFLLTLPILAYLYHRDGRFRVSSAAVAYASVLYALGLACFTLYPLPSGEAGPGITYGVPPQLVPFMAVADVAKDGLPALFQIVANVVLFVPLGFIAGRLLRLRLVPTVLLGLGASLLVETAQLTGLFGIYSFAYRTFDVDDLMTNTTGALIGYGLSALAGRVLPAASEGTPVRTERPGLVRRAVALWIDTTIMGAAVMLAIVGVDLVLALTGGHEAAIARDQTAYHWLEAGSVVLLVGLFALVEVVVPWRRGGSTPGGAFVRMTFETRPRTGWRRVIFYAARTAALGLLLAFPLIAVPVLLIFYAICRQMPYDLLPAQPAPPTSPAASVATP